METDFPYFESGKFYVGANYWASNAGMYMWRDWSPETVAEDFRKMGEAGLRIVRMFPLWPDFQPIEQTYGGSGVRRGYLFKGGPFPETETGRCGVDETMLERLAFVLDKAAENNIAIMLALVTGWMSGRLFVPPAFEGRNVLTDTEVIKWEVRFVRRLVRRFRSHPAIVAWDLGNECNCMAPVANEGDAWSWMNAISSAIRIEDATRPVVSGMHGLRCEPNGAWHPWDVGELNDILNTHPYPLFTEFSNLARVNTMRNAFHATAESRLYADLGGRPCTVEEAGNLGPMYSSQETAAAYLNNMLWNSYAHDCRSLLWWCAFDFSHLPFPPYEWNAMERELGLFDSDGNKTLQLKTLSEFQQTIDGFGMPLPEFRKDAVCILTDGQNNWGAAYASFILAKQAGFDIEFQYARQPLKDSNVYIVPSISSDEAIYRNRYMQLLENVKDGASLLVTWSCGSLQPFEKVFGVRPEWRRQGAGARKVAIDGATIEFSQQYQLALSAHGADVIATDQDGMPVLTLCKYGKGNVAFLSLGIEAELAGRPDAFDVNSQPIWKFYRWFADVAGIRRIVRSNDPFVTCTEHRIDASHVIVIAVNNTPDERKSDFAIANGWTVSKTLFGTSGNIAPNSAIVMEVTFR